MRISVTERQTFKRCRRKWDFASYNRQSLAPIINAPALDLGTLVHATLAAWTQDTLLDPLAFYKEASLALNQQVIDSYVQRVGCAPSQDELKATHEAMQLGMAMISNYKDKWHTALPPGFTLVANELTLIQPVPGTEHYVCVKHNPDGYCICPDCVCERDCDLTCTCLYCREEAYHELECTFDGVMQDANGDLYIIERKTFSRTPSVDELTNNDQFLAYQWALSQHYSNVVGLAYDGLLKKVKPPAGKTYSDLFLRRILLRNRHELEEFGTLLAYELNEMADPNLKITKTVPPVVGCQRWECSFIDVCHAISKGEPTEYMMRMFQRTEHKKHLDLVSEE